MIEMLRQTNGCPAISTPSISLEKLKKIETFANRGGGTLEETEHVKRLFHYIEINADVHGVPHPAPTRAPAPSTGGFATA